MSWRQIYFLLSCCLILMETTQAQVKFNNKYAFRNGFYTSFNDLKKDVPSHKLKTIPNLRYETDNEHNVLILTEASIEVLEKSPIQSLDNIWGICIRDKPYVKIQPKKEEEEVFFVKLHVLGKLSFLYYRTFQDVEVVMNIYNPYTGEKVAEKSVMNREPVLVEQIMDFETGRFYAYTSDSFKKQIKDDQELTETVNNMKAEELKEKLFKTLLIYNDRNPVYLSK